jgi:hypothetical protein
VIGNDLPGFDKGFFRDFPVPQVSAVKNVSWKRSPPHLTWYPGKKLFFWRSRGFHHGKSKRNLHEKRLEK